MPQWITSTRGNGTVRATIAVLSLTLAATTAGQAVASQAAEGQALAGQALAGQTTARDVVHFQPRSDGVTERCGGPRLRSTPVLSDRPESMRGLPEGLVDPRFAVLELGPESARRRYGIVVDRAGEDELRFFADVRGTGDLSASPACPARWIDVERNGGVERQFEGEVVLEFGKGPELFRASIGLRFTAPGDPASADSKERLEYWADYGLEGTISFAGVEYPALLRDEAVRGDFRGSAEVPGFSGVRLYLDLDHDGRFDRATESFDSLLPFAVGGVAYQLRSGSVLRDSPAGSWAFEVVRAETIPPRTRVLLLTGGGYHDYASLGPLLESALEATQVLDVEIGDGLERLRDPHFADAYDVVIHDFCYDQIEPESLEHALETTRAGKPTVLIHCAVHAFRKSDRIRDWEDLCGMRSKVHDAYGPFGTRIIDPDHPTLHDWPADWRTPGDELYQTIELLPESHALLEAQSPWDQRVHTVCWTREFGKGRVFSTTLGHDARTASQPVYQELLARGVLWAVGRVAERSR